MSWKPLIEVLSPFLLTIGRTFEGLCFGFLRGCWGVKDTGLGIKSIWIEALL